MRRSIKYIVYLFGSLLLLLMLLLGFTQTAIFRDIVKKKAESIINEQINAQIAIESIEGNFINNLIINEISLTSSDQIIYKTPQITIRYSLGDLLQKKITIDSLMIKEPYINLWQEPDSSWNVSHIIKPSVDQAKDTSSTFPLTIYAKKMVIDNGLIHSQSHIKQLPNEINRFNLATSGMYAHDSIQVNLQQLSFSSLSPSLHLQQLSAKFFKGSHSMGIDSLIIRTAQSNINGEGSFQSIKSIQSKLSADPVSKDEIALFIPQLKLNTSPGIKTQITSKGDTIQSHFQLKAKNETITIEATIRSLWDALKSNEKQAPFSANLKFENVRPETWITMPKTNSQINGFTDIKGENLLHYNSSLLLTADLGRSYYHDHQIDTLLVKAHLINDSLNVSGTIVSAIGQSELNGQIKQLFNTPKYSGTICGYNLLPHIISPLIEGTELNTCITFTGEGFAPVDQNILANIRLYDSKLYHVPIDSSYISAQLQSQQVKLDTIVAFLPDGIINGKGNYKLTNQHFNAQITTHIDSLQFIEHYYHSDLTFDHANGSINATGTPDSLFFEGVISSHQLKGYSTNIQFAQSDFSGLIQEQKININANLNARQISASDIKLDTLQSSIQLNNKTLFTNTQAHWTDTLSTHIQSSVIFEDTLTINLPKLEINTLISQFYTPDSTQSLQWHDNNLHVNNFVLKDHLNPNFNLSANGLVTQNQKEDFSLKISDFNLWQLNRLRVLDDSISGLLSSDIELTGYANEPVIEGYISIEEPRYGAVSFEGIRSNINYAANTGKVDFNIPGMESTFQAYITAPLKLAFDTTGVNIDLPETFNAKMTIDSLNISQSLNKRLSNIEAEGTLSINMEASGSIDKPLFFGNIDLFNGKYVNHKYGIFYDRARAGISFDGNKVMIDTLLVKRDNGFLSATGELNFDSTLIKGKILSSTLTADANQFFIARHNNYEIQIDANTYFKAGNNKPEFGGHINVRRSDFYIPAILNTGETSEANNDDPLLVQAMKKAPDSLSHQPLVAEKISRSARDASAFMENLTGRLKLEIPRNTWLKSEDMKLEIWGDMEIVKTSPYFELFGEVGINRGHYILYGKKLTITEGQIVFQGGEDIDPNLNLVAEYTYRGADREKRELEMKVSGLLSQPEINFTLDETAIPEADAISILVFGKTMDEMSFAGQNGIVGSMSSNMVAQVVTSQLSKTLGTRFNLDLIEVNATENWHSAAFVVGKYITNDLFVIYQRGFGESDDDEITPETITLEYEIGRIIFIRLQSGSSKSSGFDVILKFEPPKED